VAAGRGLTLRCCSPTGEEIEADLSLGPVS